MVSSSSPHVHLMYYQQLYFVFDLQGVTLLNNVISYAISFIEI